MSERCLADHFGHDFCAVHGNRGDTERKGRMKLYAHVSEQGTAMAETVICETHTHDQRSVADSLSYAEMETDWNGETELDEITGNDAVECIICGATGG